METYTLASEGFNRNKRRLIWFSIFFFALVVAAVLYFSPPLAPEPQLQESDSPINPVIGYLVAGVFLAVILSITTRNNIKKLRTRWLSYRLTLSTTTITKEEADLPTMTIQVEDVTKLLETPGEGVMIKTAQKHEFIFIPASLIGYDQVKSELARFREVELESNSTFSVRLALFLFLAVLVVGLIYAVMSSNRVLFVLPVGALLILFFGWGLIESQRSPLYNKQQKQLMWGMVLPCIAILAKIISVLL